jgi:thiamine-phosphate pyrophosphorylase
MSLHLVIGQADCLHYSIDALVSAAVKGGVTHVQLREKCTSTGEFIEIGQRLKRLLKPYGIPLIINDRVDIALTLEAEGVHLGQSDMPYPEARRLLGLNKIIGLTVETLEQMQKANQWDIQYVGIGPVFPTQTKLDAPEPLDISGLTTFCRLSRHPVIAIGGIHIGNAEAVLNTGTQGIAVVSAIGHTRQPEQMSHTLKQIILKRNP